MPMMKKITHRRQLPHIDVINEYFLIDPNNGSITHKSRPSTLFSCSRVCNSWNARFSGKDAGHIDGNGYAVVSIAGGKYMAHRVIWKYVHGTEPDELDHINRNPSDNRILNLRAATRSENNRNRGLSKYNTSGFRGIYASGDHWIAQIKIFGEATHLGRYGTIDEAIAARHGVELYIEAHATSAMVKKYAGPARQVARAKEAQGKRK